MDPMWCARFGYQLNRSFQLDRDVSEPTGFVQGSNLRICHGAKEGWDGQLFDLVSLRSASER